MDVTEAASRLVLRYWLVVTLTIAVPIMAVGAYVLHSPHTYTARTRLLAAPTVPQAQAQADAVVSQVQAVATSRDLVTAALATAGINRDPSAIVKSITISGVGSSGLVDLSYTDTSAAVAQRVDVAVSDLVVTRLLALRAGVPELVQNFDDLIAALDAKRATVAGVAHAGARTEALVTNLDDLISDMTADRTRLSAFGQSGASVAIVDAATLPPVDGDGLMAKLAVALLLGLVLGLLVAGANETLRPRVAGAVRVARLLDVPMLGRVGSDLAATADIGRRLRLASRRESATSVVLMRADGTPVAPELVNRLRVVTLSPTPMPRQWSIGQPLTDAAASTSYKTEFGTGEARIDSVTTNGVDRGGNGAGGGVTANHTGTEAGSETGTATSTLTVPMSAASTDARPRHVISLDDLDAGSEGERIGLVVIAGRTTSMRAISNVNDLISATGWPMLGVLDDPQNRSGMR
jgi:capsular polysaccharide biosynthesis protein